MDLPFPQWKAAHRFNTLIAPPAHHYVLLLTRTRAFDLNRDLKQSLSVTKKPLIWFVRKFRKYGVQVEYGTVFTQRDLRHFGPVATTVSHGIVRTYLGARYSRSVVFVCPPGLAKQLPFEIITPDTLLHRITTTTTTGG